MRVLLCILFLPFGAYQIIKSSYKGICILTAFYLVAPRFWGLPGFLRPVFFFTAVTAVSCMLYVFKGKSIVITRDFLILSLLFLCMCISSNYAVVSQEVSVQYLKDVFKLVIAAFLTINALDSPKQVKIVIWSMLISTLWLSKTTFISGFGASQRVDFVVGLGLGPNFVAMVVGMLLPLVIGFCGSSNALEKKVAWLLLPIFVLTMVLTGSRAGFLALALSAYFSFLKSKRKGKFLLALFVVISFGLAFAPQYYTDRMGSIFADEKEASAQSRLDLWKAGISMWHNHPYWGVGPANFALLSPNYVEWRGARTGTGLQAHNMYIEFLAEGGLQGVVLFAGLLLSLYVGLSRIKTEDSNLLIMRDGLKYGVVNYALFAFLGPVFFRDIFFYFLGIASILPVLANKQLDT